jgi:hypothetical protein
VLLKILLLRVGMVFVAASFFLLVTCWIYACVQFIDSFDEFFCLGVWQSWVCFFITAEATCLAVGHRGYSSNSSTFQMFILLLPWFESVFPCSKSVCGSEYARNSIRLRQFAIYIFILIFVCFLYPVFAQNLYNQGQVQGFRLTLHWFEYFIQ